MQLVRYEPANRLSSLGNKMNELEITEIKGDLKVNGLLFAGSAQHQLINSLGLLAGGKLQAGTVANAAIANSTLTLAKFATASLSQAMSWSPTITPGTNVSSVGATNGFYTRIDGAVYGALLVPITPTSADVVTEFQVTPPIAASFSTAAHALLLGLSTHTGGVSRGWRGLANTSLNLIDVRGNSSGTGTQNIVCFFAHRT